MFNLKTNLISGSASGMRDGQMAERGSIALKKY